VIMIAVTLLSIRKINNS
jgi:hypothetical protein